MLRTAPCQKRCILLGIPVISLGLIEKDGLEAGAQEC